MRLNAHNGDRHLRLPQRAAYLLLNALDNARPDAALDSGLGRARFASESAADAVRGLRTPSPSRALCDQFWAQLPWPALARDLGPLHMIDLGCGSGEYAEKFQAWSGGRIARYTGIDVQPHPRWTALGARHSFAEFRSGNIEAIGAALPPPTNLIVSQSVFEHVRDEAGAFDQLRAFAHAAGRPVLQLHAVPSAACLRLFLWHGFRQYTPRTVSAITKRFADCSDRTLVALGGPACNAVHWRFITWPVFVRRRRDLRDLDPDGYRLAMARAIARDLDAPGGAPSFYVVVIYSNPREPLPASDCWRAVSGAT